MTQEHTQLIATRVPPGDNWALISSPTVVIPGLVNVLNEYVKETKFKGEYRLAPLNGLLYAIVEKNVEPPKPDTYDLYGEGL
jgi:hypothetical protein